MLDRRAATQSPFVQLLDLMSGCLRQLADNACKVKMLEQQILPSTAQKDGAFGAPLVS